MFSNNIHMELGRSPELKTLYSDQKHRLMLHPEHDARSPLNKLIYTVKPLAAPGKSLKELSLAAASSTDKFMKIWDSTGKIIDDSPLRLSVLLRICTTRGRELLECCSQRVPVPAPEGESPAADAAAAAADAAAAASPESQGSGRIYALTSEQVQTLLGPSVPVWTESGYKVTASSDKTAAAMSIYLPNLPAAAFDPAGCFIMHYGTWHCQEGFFDSCFAGVMNHNVHCDGVTLPVPPAASAVAQVQAAADGATPVSAPDAEPEDAAAGQGACPAVNAERLAAFGLVPSDLATVDELPEVYALVDRVFASHYLYNNFNKEVIRKRLEQGLVQVLRDDKGMIEFVTVYKCLADRGFIDFFLRNPDSQNRGLAMKMTEKNLAFGRMMGWDRITLCHLTRTAALKRIYTSVGYQPDQPFNCIISHNGPA